jgi:hypothetical protein
VTTTTNTGGSREPAIHALYSDATYDVGTLASYFSSVNEAWRLVFFLAAYRALLVDRHVAYIDWLDADQPMIAYEGQNVPDWLEQSMRRVPKRGSSDPSAGEVWLTMFELPPLMFERIHLNSLRSRSLQPGVRE